MFTCNENEIFNQKPSSNYCDLFITYLSKEDFKTLINISWYNHKKWLQNQ